MKKYKIVVICMCILLLLAGGVYAQQKTVRILAIGNSFSQDAVEQYLHELAEAEGISTIIGQYVYWRLFPGTSCEKCP